MCLNKKRQLELFLSNLERCKLFIFYILLLFLCIFSKNTQALSTYTALTIQGTKPYFTLNGVKVINMDELAGFSYPDSEVSSGIVKIDTTKSLQMNSANVVTIPSNVKESDIVTVSSFSAASGDSPISLSSLVIDATHPLKVQDDDGDAATLAMTSANGTISIVMKKDGNVIFPSNNQLNPCSDYTLDINIATSGTPTPSVSAKTKYGEPNDSQNDYAAKTATYKLLPQGIGICYFQPNNMNIYTTGTSFTNGYNPTVWKAGGLSSNSSAMGGGFTQTGGGFTVNSGFPTTGFENAIFSIIGSGSDQSRYRCTSTDSGSKISLSGGGNSVLGLNCKITYLSATKALFTAGGTTPTVNFEYNNSTTSTPNWIRVGTYTIPNPSKWAVFKGKLKYGDQTKLSDSSNFPALDACSGETTSWQQAAGQNTSDRTFRQQFMFRRDELTNSPYANASIYPENAYGSLGGYVSRDVGSFMGEWGFVYNGYPNSGWSVSNGYWVAEAWSTTDQYLVVANGSVSFYSPNYESLVAVCRDSD